MSEFTPTHVRKASREAVRLITDSARLENRSWYRGSLDMERVCVFVDGSGLFWVRTFAEFQEQFEPVPEAQERGQVREIVEFHLKQHTFRKNDDGSVEVDPDGLVLGLVDALMELKGEPELVALSASERACYLWPDDTEQARACRAAYIDGAKDYTAQTRGANPPTNRSDVEKLAKYLCEHFYVAEDQGDMEWGDPNLSKWCREVYINCAETILRREF